MLKRLISNYVRTRISLLMAGILALCTLSPVSYAYAQEPETEIEDCLEADQSAVMESETDNEEVVAVGEDEDTFTTDATDLTNAEAYDTSRKAGYWVLYKDGLLVISANQNGKKNKVITTSDAGWSNKERAKYKNKITKVYISEGIGSIDGSSFYECTMINEVHLSSTLRTVGTKAFYGCAQLTNIVLPEGLSKIGSYAFSKCKNLQSVRWHAPITYTKRRKSYRRKYVNTKIETAAFKDCKNLVAADIPGVFNGRDLFAGCTSLTAVFISTKISSKAFDDSNKSLKRIYYTGTQKEYNNYWKKNKYRDMFSNLAVYYDSNGMQWYKVEYNTLGHGSVSSIEIPERCVIKKMPQPMPYQEFDGKKKYVSKWLKNRNNANSDYKFGSEEVTSNLVLYANWEDAQPVSVNFYSVSGQLFLTETVYQGRLIPEPETKPVREGFEFRGWFDREDTYKAGELYYPESDEEKYSFNEDYLLSDKDVSIFAHWSEEGLGGFWTSELAGITISMNYTDQVDFDGRKHQYKDGKKKDTASVAYDIKVGNMVIKEHDTVVPDIKIKKVTVKNNQNNPNNWELEAAPGKIPMIGVTVYTDSKNGGRKELVKILNKMMNAKGKFEKDEDDEKYFVWDGDPIELTINPVEFTSVNSIYTKDEVKNNPELAEKDGIFIYSGGTKVNWKKYREDGDLDIVSLKAEIKGLQYQKVFDTGDGKKKVKRISLKPGGWTLKRFSETEDGETDSWYEERFNAKKCEYYIDYNSVSLGDEKISFNFTGNFDGSLTFERSAGDKAKDPSYPESKDDD